MKQRAKNLALGLTLFSLGACGVPHPSGKHMILQKQLQTGRRVARSIPSGDTNGNFLLKDFTADASLLGYKESDDSQLVLWALFDTNLNEKVEPNDVTRHAKSYIESHFDMFQVGLSDLDAEPRVILITDRLLSISFARSWHDIPVRDANIELIYSKQDSGSYRLREVVNAGLGNIAVENDSGIAASWNDVRSLFPDENLQLVSSRQVLYTKVLLDTKKKHSLATEFTVKDAVSEISLVITLENETNEILEAYENLYSAQPKPLLASVFKRTYLDPEKTFKPLPLIQVTAGNSQAKSDLDGRLDLDGAKTATLSLTSERGQINLAQANTPYQVNAQITANDAYSITPTGDGLTALNAYTALLEINSFVRRNMTVEEAAILGKATVTRINVRGNCNAFYDPQVSAISLYAAGNGCANIAQINDVIYHEWGHGLDNFTGKAVGITDGAFSEGIGDIISGFRTSNNVLAPGFLVNDATGIRNLDNSTKYPDDQGEVHAEGQIIAGAFWDMRKGLISKLGQTAGAAKAETIFFRHLLTTDTYLDSYQAALRLDDDDGNPATQSTNHCTINAAFAKHGLAQNENCLDKPIELAVPIDETLVAGIVKSDEAGFLLMASSAQAAQMSICFDSKEACFASGKQTIQMEREGVLNGKTTFITGQPLKVKPLQTLTLIGKDAKGVAIGARMVRLITK